MGAAEVLTSYIDVSDYEQVARSIYKQIQNEMPSMGSQQIKMQIGDIKVMADVSVNEEDFEHFQVDQLRLNTLYLTDENGFALDCEEEIGDLIDELIESYNEKEYQEAERTYQYA